MVTWTPDLSEMRVWDTPPREPLGPVEVPIQGEESLGRGWGGGVGRGDSIRYRFGAIVVAAQAVVILLFLLLCPQKLCPTRIL